MASFAGHGTTAPASSHTYLNFESDQNPFGGRQFLNVGTNEHVYLPILTVDLVLFPNAILPLLTRGEAEKQIIEEIIGTKPLDLLRPGRFERDLSLEHRKGFFGVCLRTGSGVQRLVLWQKFIGMDVLNKLTWWTTTMRSREVLMAP